MSKVKINLASGSVIEKPLVTCFKGTNGNYIVFDNETNGQMGYPIICISKFDGNSVEKILDQAEWQAVKENLKTIIGGTALPYLSVPESLNAQEDFFTQLTLPVASFDLLKNVYSPAVEAVSVPDEPTINPIVSPMPETAPVASPSLEPSMPAAPTMEPTSIGLSEPVSQAADANFATPIASPISEPVADVNTAPIMPAPVIDANPATMPASEVPPAINATVPEMSSETSQKNQNDIEAIKESFMKSCETMFDALIKKFENK